MPVKELRQKTKKPCNQILLDELVGPTNGKSNSAYPYEGRQRAKLVQPVEAEYVR